MANLRIKRISKAIAMATIIFSAVACDCDDDWNEEHHHYYEEHHSSSSTPSKTIPPVNSESDKITLTLANGESIKVQRCQESTTEGAISCLEKENIKWQANCVDGACNLINVRVFYMLTEDLGSDQRVIVEAFDNSSFKEKPVASVALNQFDARKPGGFADAELLLGSGQYYLRAYIDRSQGEESPYEYAGMNLVSESPVGLYGALSDAQQITVIPELAAKQHNIYLDKLFKAPEAEEPTRAYVRMLLDSSDLGPLDLGKQIKVEFFDKADFNFEPVYSFAIASENFRVDGRSGFAEFVTPELDEGKYFVRVYYDKDSNGYYDQQDPSYVYRMYGEAARIKVIKHRTETIPCRFVKPVESVIETANAEKEEESVNPTTGEEA